ncbi:hypothetical protein GGX14DRAFT_559199 [Mycena pura]|uniref:Uncharacterized protein n=1 Tax=Mycena pura TaxID=153505 RepID=A0AAD6VT31_9AGAR|nr:hypothetical protein GGX14DRAFT_559199 [Mycena pura]
MSSSYSGSGSGSGSVVSSNRPYSFSDDAKKELAIKSNHQCSICKADAHKDDDREHTDQWEAAHCIAASDIGVSPQLTVAVKMKIVSTTGPDAHEALGVSDAKRNGMWRAYYPLPSSGYELKIASLFKVPQSARQGGYPLLKVLRAILNEFEPSEMTLQQFLKNYTKDFPALRSQYHLLRTTPGAVSMYMGPARPVNIYHQPFLLHDTNSSNLARHIFATTDSTEPHIWHLPCLKPENVMAVLLYMTGKPQAIYQKLCLTLGDCVLDDDRILGGDLTVPDDAVPDDDRILKLVHEWRSQIV